MKKTSLIMQLAAVFIMILSGCTSGDEGQRFVPDFEFSAHPTDANVVVFKNTTQGEQYYWQWKFGNGTQTSKLPVSDEEIVGFYPKQGDYEVTLTIWGSPSDLSDNQSVTKKITINNDVFVASFTVEQVQGKANVYRITNTTTGSFDAVKWMVNGKEMAGVANEQELYFPFKGQNKVELMVKAGNYEQQIAQTILVSADDPQFFTHYSLQWSDEFNGTNLDLSQWSYDTGANGWGNAEWQNYTNGDNAMVADGTLKIVAKKIGVGQKVGDYTSSRILSKQAFTYGIYEIRAKMPTDKGPGVWPAIWMLGESIRKGTSWPLCGEMDIMEYVSFDPNTTSSTIHTQSNNHMSGNGIGSGHLPLESAEEEFHTYGLIWTENFLRFYRDEMSNVILSYNLPSNATPSNWPFDQPFFFILNMAVGGNYGGVKGVDDTIFPAQMEVDYVRVYQLN